MKKIIMLTLISFLGILYSSDSSAGAIGQTTRKARSEIREGASVDSAGAIGQTTRKVRGETRGRSVRRSARRTVRRRSR